MYFDLDDLKNHLNVDLDFHDDDLYILNICTAAEDAVERHIDRPFDDLVDENGMLPSALAHAILLLVGHFYNNRESVGYGSYMKIPIGYEYLVSLFKDYSTDESRHT